MVNISIMVAHYKIAVLATFALAISSSTLAKWDIIQRSRLRHCADRAHPEKWLCRQGLPNVLSAKQELMKTRMNV